MTQTGVDYFASELTKQGFYVPKWIYDEAKRVEKEQSINDYCEGFKASAEGWNGEYGPKNMANIAKEIKAEQYYNETYGK